MKKSLNLLTNKKSYIDAVLLLVVIIWGVKPIMIKIGLATISAMQYNVWRLLFATIAAWVSLIISRKEIKLDKRDMFLMIIISVFGFFVFQWFYGIGIAKTTAGNASIVMGILPLNVTILNHLLKIEKITKQKIGGIVISLIGLLLVVSSSGEIGLFYENMVGIIYIFIAAVGYSIYMVFSKYLTKKYSPKVVTTYAITITFVLAISFSGFDIHLNDMNRQLFFSLIYSGVIAMFVANYLWTWAIKKTSSTRVAIYNNLTPVVALVFGAIFLKEKIAILQILGGVFIILSFYVSTYTRKKNI